jgi:inner membrane protein involved in colicin E2 resistance
MTAFDFLRMVMEGMGWVLSAAGAFVILYLIVKDEMFRLIVFAIIGFLGLMGMVFSAQKAPLSDGEIEARSEAR